MSLQKYLAPAKINLCLHVNGKRDDGYHELTMVMQRISLYDELDFTIVDRAGVHLHCSVTLGDDENNLVVRAARALLAYDHCSRGVEITLRKNIPVAAGLGGGSSDAATTLMALNEILNLKLDTKTLHREALALGADVPFFLYQSVAWATGIGDQFTPLQIDLPYWIVLVNPEVGVSTAEVYGDLSRDDYSCRSLIASVESRDELLELLHNDLERAASSKCPAIRTIKNAFKELAADGVLMSGSGATVFGVFFDLDCAQHAASAFVEKYGYWSHIVTPLS